MSRSVPALHRHPLTRPEMIVAMVILLALTITLTATKIMHVASFQGDTALYFQLTENIAERGEPISSAYTNILAYATGHYVTQSASQIATDPLAAPSGVEGNVLFTLHAYYIMYPIGLIAKVVPAPQLLMTLYAIAFVGMLALTYLAMRRKHLPIAATLLFCLIVVSHPAWAQSLVAGQFYPDRLFMLLGLIFMYLLSRDDVPRSALVAAAVLAALVIERAAITAGLFAIAYVLLYWKRPTLDRYFKLGLGVALVMYGAFLLKFALANPAYSSFLPSSWVQVVVLFGSPGFADKTELFLLINAFLLVIALFEWRAAVIAAFVMLPNVFGNIGGAEKIGWATHYHSFYFPALVWAATAGFVVAYRKAAAARRLPIFYVAGFAIVLALSSIEPFSFKPFDISPANIANNFVLSFPGTAAYTFGPAGRQTYAASQTLGRAIPEGASVTTPEGAMAFLYRHRAMHFYPLGIDTADYAVLGETAAPGSKHPIYSGALSFLGSGELKRINDVLVARMARDGYDLDHPFLVPEFGLAIVRRSKTHSEAWSKAYATANRPAMTAVATAIPSPAHTYLKPGSVAAVVAHSATVAAHGAATSNDLTGRLKSAPTVGHVIVAFGSTGFGCAVAPGWTLVGTDPSTSTAVAYHIVRAGDTAAFVPFTTSAANGYALELIEIAGGPDVLGSAQAGGGYIDATRITNRPTLIVPQVGGVLLQLYAGLGGAAENNPLASFASTLPHGQKQMLIERIPRTGNAFELIAQATTTDPFKAAQPFATEQTMTFPATAPPGNIGVGWLVWVSGSAH